MSDNILTAALLENCRAKCAQQAIRLERLENFRRLVANMICHGEMVDGLVGEPTPFEMEPDDAIQVLNGLIAGARDLKETP